MSPGFAGGGTPPVPFGLAGADGGLGTSQRLGRALEVAADVVGELVDLLLGSRQVGLGLRGARGRPPLGPARLPVGPCRPRRPAKKSHHPVPW
jgi:hypothetical protein